jgi:hypothetical protein
MCSVVCVLHLNRYRMDASLYATSPVSEGEAATDDAAFDTTF